MIVSSAVSAMQANLATTLQKSLLCIVVHRVSSQNFALTSISLTQYPFLQLLACVKYLRLLLCLPTLLTFSPCSSWREILAWAALHIGSALCNQGLAYLFKRTETSEIFKMYALYGLQTYDKLQANWSTSLTSQILIAVICTERQSCLPHISCCVLLDYVFSKILLFGGVKLDEHRQRLDVECIYDVQNSLMVRTLKEV